jgi:ABC-type amino acid transport substrate-binding protein
LIPAGHPAIKLDLYPVTMDLLLCTAESAVMTTAPMTNGNDAPFPSSAPDRRRAIRALLVWLISAQAVVAGDTRADLLIPAERAWLAAHPRILLGVGAEWAPWVIPVGEGRVTGFAVDHLRLLGDKLGIEIGLEAGPWQAMVAAAEGGRLDGLTMAAPLPERGDRFLFTEDLHTVHLFLIPARRRSSSTAGARGVERPAGRLSAGGFARTQAARLRGVHRGGCSPPVPPPMS